jgi:hypothetical protein
MLLAECNRIGGLPIRKADACAFITRRRYVHLLIPFTFG